MRFKTGVLGVVVIIVAIAGTLMGSWVMSMDVEEVEVTRYNALADITGEFTSEQTPTFTSYNPSTNYTGYYTDDSIIDSTKYFDGVDFNASKPNNYRVNLMPTDSESRTKQLSTAGAYDDGNVVYIRAEIDGRQITAYSLKLSDVIASWDYSDWSKIIIKNTDSNINWDDYADIDGNWVAFVPISWVELVNPVAPFIVFKNPNISLQEAKNAFPYVQNFRNPTVAAEYIAATDSLQIFYDNDLSNSAGVYKPSDVMVLFGSTSDSDDVLGLGMSVDVTALKLPDATYLDPSAGVVIS